MVYDHAAPVAQYLGPIDKEDFRLQESTDLEVLIRGADVRIGDEGNRLDLNQSQGGMCICLRRGIVLGIRQQCFGP